MLRARPSADAGQVSAATASSSAESGETRAPVAAGAVLLLCAIVAAVDLGGPIFYPGLGQIATEFGITPAQAQMTVTVNIIGAAVSQPFLGPAADWLGRRRVLIISLLALASLSLLMLTITDFSVLIAVRALQGFLGSAGIVLARAIAHDMFPDQRQFTRVVSYLVVTTGACSLAGPLIAGALVSEYGWRAPIAMLGVFGAIVTLATFVWFRRNQTSGGMGGVEASTWPGWKALGALLRHPAFYGNTALLSFSMASLFTLFGLSPLMLAGGSGEAPMQVGVLVSLLSLGFMAGALAAGFRPATTGIVRIASAGIAVGFAIIAGSMMASGASLATIVPGGILVALASGYLNPVSLAGALQANPRLAGTASGWSSAFSLLVAGIGTQLATTIYGVNASWLVVIGAVYALFCWLSIKPAMKGSEQTSTASA